MQSHGEMFLAGFQSSVPDFGVALQPPMQTKPSVSSCDLKGFLKGFLQPVPVQGDATHLQTVPVLTEGRAQLPLGFYSRLELNASAEHRALLQLSRFPGCSTPSSASRKTSSATLWRWEVCHNWKRFCQYRLSKKCTVRNEKSTSQPSLWLTRPEQSLPSAILTAFPKTMQEENKQTPSLFRAVIPVVPAWAENTENPEHNQRGHRTARIISMLKLHSSRFRGCTETVSETMTSEIACGFE